MHYVTFGNSGLKVSPIAVGTMAFGRWIDEKTSHQLLDEAIDQGVNFIDTANFYGTGQDEPVPYGTGETETIIGQYYTNNKNAREKTVLATKVGLPMGHGPNQSGLSRKHIITELDNSLMRLKTDYIDLYQVHLYDPQTPLEETLRALDDAVKAGKVRYIGCSNFTAWQIAKSKCISQTNNLTSFISVQPPYNLIKREIERELIPYAKSENIAIMSYSPLARGILSEKYHKGENFPAGTRASSGEPLLLELLHDETYRKVDELKKIANDEGVSLRILSMAWLLNHPDVTSIITGISKKYHITQAVEALDTHWDEQKWQNVNERIKSIN